MTSKTRSWMIRGAGIVTPLNAPRSLWIAGIAIALALFSPIAGLITQAFGSDEGVFAHLVSTVLDRYIGNTAMLIVRTLSLVLLFGVFSGWVIARWEFPGRTALRWALLLPLAVPPYVNAYIYTDLLDYAGPIQRWVRLVFGWSSVADYRFFDIRSIDGAAMVLSLTLFPYVYLLARSAFMEQPAHLFQAARSLGAGPWRQFWKISLPLARPAIFVGASLAALETLGDFGAVSYFAVPTLTQAVYDTWLGFNNLGAAARLSCFILLAVFTIFFWEYRNRCGGIHFQCQGMRMERTRLPLKIGWSVAAGCWLLVFLGLGLPLIVLLRYVFIHGSSTDLTRFVDLASSSLKLALIAALVTTLLALPLTLLRRWGQGRAASWPLRLASLGYATPGTVIAIGSLIAISSLDQGLNRVWAAATGEPYGLIFSGTTVAIGFAFVVRFMMIACGAMESSLEKIPVSLDQAARLLGASTSRMARQVHLPLMGRGMIVSLLLIFIESMKELPAALLLRPFHFENLATHVYQFVSSEELERAAGSALALVAAGLLPIQVLDHALEEVRK